MDAFALSARAGGAGERVCRVDWIYCPQEGRRIELKTGKIEALAATQPQLCSPAMGGRLLVTLRGGNLGPREKDPGVMQAQVVDLEHPNTLIPSPAAIVDRRYEEDEAYRLKWRWRGNADSISNSSPMFAANRTFFRTAGYLWCVGDGRDPWPTPALAPPQARVSR